MKNKIIFLSGNRQIGGLVKVLGGGFYVSWGQKDSTKLFQINFLNLLEVFS